MENPIQSWANVMRSYKLIPLLVVFFIFCFGGYMTSAFGADGSRAYMRVVSCENYECWDDDCSYFPPYGIRYYCHWRITLGYYDCSGERLSGGADTYFYRAPPDPTVGCKGCTEGSPYYVYKDNCKDPYWAYLPSSWLFEDWDCHRGAVVDLRTPEMIEAGCDPYIPTQRPEVNLGWVEDPGLYCPTKVGENSVNVATGNHTERVVDLTVSGSAIPLQFVRFYNSQSIDDGPLGYGWTHNYNLSVTDLGNEILVWDSDGRALSFLREEDGTLRGRFGVKDLLEEELVGGFVFTRKKTQRRYLFDTDGRLNRIEDLNGNAIDLIYGGSDLQEVRSSFGKSFFLYYAGGRIEKIRDPKGNEILYDYDRGNLVSVIYPDTTKTTYLYEDPYDPHNMTGELDTEQRVVGLWVYDIGDKTILSEGADGADRMDLSYGMLKTLVTDSRGNAKTYNTQIKEHVYLVEKIEGQGCSGCGRNKRFRYDSGLNLVEEVDGNENTTLYEWIDEENHKTYGYDSRGNSTIKIEASGTPVERRSFYSYTYDDLSPLLIREKVEKRKSVVSPGGEKTTRWTYDGSGNLVSKEETGYVLSDGVLVQKTHTTGYGYTELGQIEWIDGPRKDVSDLTTFEYYPNTPEAGSNRGQIKAMVNALGHRTEFSEYDSNGNVGRITDPNGVVTAYTYDERNRIKTITNMSTGAVTQYVYDSHGNVAVVVLPEENKIDYAYDPGDRLVEIKDSLGNTIHYEYDTEGNTIREEISDPDGVLREYLSFEYDPYNRLKKIINPDSTFTEFDYDANGNRIATKDPNGHTMTYSYDELNRLFRVTQPGEVVTSYGYDTDDNLTSVTDGNANKTDYTYDDFGRLTETISPDTGTTTYGYDEAANLVQRTNAQGTLVSYTYDALNRPTAIRFSDSSQDITYSYDSASSSYGLRRLTGMADPSGISTYHYDAQGNLIKEQKQIAGFLYTTQYGYDKNNLLRSITYPSGRTVTYEIDEAGRVTQVDITLNGQPKTLASSIRYLPYGGIRELTYGNSLSLTRAYDMRYQISSIQAGSLINLAYTQDPNGNITEIENQNDPTRTQAFGYDTTDRLVSATGIYGSISYGYDAVGNRLNLTADGSTDSYTYETGTNRLVQVSGETTKHLTYDPNGNTLSENGRSYTYNLSDRLTSVSHDGSKLVDYMYNGAGQRVKKTTPVETRVFHYDLQGHLIAETDEQGQTLAEYVFLGDQPLAMIREGEKDTPTCFITEAVRAAPLQAQADTEEAAYYFHNDHLGTPQLLTDGQGLVVWSADYRPFGEVSIVVEGIESNLRFPGQYFDAETGLHYNYFRDYHPGVGRYVQSDSLGQFGSLNLYLYVGVSPLNYMDPLGLTRVKQRKVRWDVVLSGGVKSVTGLGFLIGLGLAGSSTSGVGLVALASAATGAGIAFAFGTTEVIAGIQGKELPIGDTWDIFIQAFVKPGEARECITAVKDAAKLLPGLAAGRLQIPSNQIMEVAEFIRLGFSIGKSAYEIEQELIDAGLLVPVPQPDAGYNPDWADFPYYPYP